MNGEIYRIFPRMIHKLVPDPSHELKYAAAISSYMLVGTYKGQTLCIVGVIPVNIMSEHAYIWCHTFAATKDHKLVFARHAKSVIANLLTLYPILAGHCLTESAAKWLRSLGAEFISENQFELRRP